MRTRPHSSSPSANSSVGHLRSNVVTPALAADHAAYVIYSGHSPTPGSAWRRSRALGQVVRLIVAAPGSTSARHPVGNTDQGDAGLMTRWRSPDDLAPPMGG
ncbi:DUF3703 domain-containing protein [Mycobacterium hodleri]|uniref:DUF3703 domain-containing protein n=1 Tax=Mycolicibacterium hodleri TaxID=49897 RepID=A0A544W652_9MYCO|nr:DUF3703 domain-containing protein [Mycolicibacterium hodleri]